MRALPRRLAQLGAALVLVGLLGGSLLLARKPFREALAGRDLGRARRLLAEGHDDQAAGALGEALRRRPDLADARRLLAELELQRGRLEQAFLMFQSLAELEPENAEGWLGLARVRVAAGQPAEAEASLDRVLELAPDRLPARILRSEVRFQVGRYRGALLDATDAVRRDPKNARAWAALARATARLQETAAGVEVAERGIAQAGAEPSLVDTLAALRKGPAEAAPPSDLLRVNAADRAERWPGALGALMRDVVAKLQRRDWTAAEGLAAAATRDYPATGLGPWLEGVIHLSRGQLEPAEQSLLQALTVAPRSHRAVTNLVAVWSRQRGPLYTGDRLLGLTREDPGFEYPISIAAHAYLEGDQPARAEATARLAFGALPGFPAPYREMADLYLQLDRPGDALDVCAQGLERFPADTELQLRQARASLGLGDRERAIGFYEGLVRQSDNPAAAAELAVLLLERPDEASKRRALELVHGLELDGPMDAAVLGAMGRVYLSVANDAPRALIVLGAAVRGAPDDPSLRYHLALARRMTGASEAAATELRAALAVGRPFPEEAEARRLLHELGGEK
jgi:cellulose synthase operon protein C